MLLLPCRFSIFFVAHHAAAAPLFISRRLCRQQQRFRSRTIIDFSCQHRRSRSPFATRLPRDMMRAVRVCLLPPPPFRYVDAPFKMSAIHLPQVCALPITTAEFIR